MLENLPEGWIVLQLCSPAKDEQGVHARFLLAQRKRRCRCGGGRCGLHLDGAGCFVAQRFLRFCGFLEEFVLALRLSPGTRCRGPLLLGLGVASTLRVSSRRCRSAPAFCANGFKGSRRRPPRPPRPCTMLPHSLPLTTG